MKRPTLFILLLLLLAACGNPHMNSEESKQMKRYFDALQNGEIPPVAVPKLAIEVKTSDNKDEINLEAKNTNSDSTQVLIKNISDMDILLNVSLAEGKVFSKEFNGSLFKEAAQCDKTLAKGASCYLDINFSSTKAGIYQDKLIVNYALVAAPNKSLQKVVALKADRVQESEVEDEISLKIQTKKRKSVLDFGVIKDKDDKTQIVKISNTGKKLVMMKIEFRLGDHFAFSGFKYPGIEGNCDLNLKKNRSCTVEVEFIATEAGQYIDDLIVTYMDPETQKSLTFTMNLLGEKIKGE